MNTIPQIILNLVRCVASRSACGFECGLDIAGANGAGWQSVLVKTGVYTGGQPTHQPTHYAEDVEEAVRWAIDREMKGRH
jgi:hypothetical protein